MTRKSEADIFAPRPGRSVPRGELWLGTEVLTRAGQPDSVQGHLHLAEQLCHDLVCFSVADEPDLKPALGYSYFSCADLGSAVAAGRQTVAAVVDGPFQSLVARLGLMQVATGLYQRQTALMEAFASEQAHALALIQKCLEQGCALVVIADDLATQQGPLFSPADVESLCGDFYIQAAQLIHAAGARLFWHCCGNITLLMPLIEAWRLDGLAAVQHSTSNLIALSEALGHRLYIMSGIDNELLDGDTPPSDAVKALEQIVTTLAPTGRLILGSSCGLYKGDFLPRIKAIYRMADRLH